MSELEDLRAGLRKLRTVTGILAAELDLDLEETRVRVKAVAPDGGQRALAVSLAECFADVDRLLDPSCMPWRPTPTGRPAPAKRAVPTEERDMAELEIESLMPTDTPPWMAPAWAGCMSWAIGEPEIRAAFEAEAGLAWRVPTLAIDRMIDDATGASEDYVRRFVAWANENVWGALDGPPAPPDASS